MQYGCSIWPRHRFQEKHNPKKKISNLRIVLKYFRKIFILDIWEHSAFEIHSEYMKNTRIEDT